jgi:alanyl-tRNA synthetase
MTDRLYYSDSYLRDFRARVVEAAPDGLRVYLDRTAFYPTSGGQPFDVGTLGGTRVVEVIDEEDRIGHVLASPLASTQISGDEIEGVIDWPRRFDHMQQHTGQHLLSAVFEDLYSMPTLSFHLGVESSTIDLGASSLNPDQAMRVEERCAEIVAQARPVIVSYEDAASASDLRKESTRTGTLRIVSIEGLDRSACGGTHVSSTAEIGPVLTRKVEKMRGNVRIEFACGLRALRQARQDYRLLSEIGRALSASYERAPEWISSSAARLKALEKSNQRLSADLAAREARELHGSTTPDADGLRRLTQRGPIDDAMRIRAQAFIAGGGALFLAISDDPPAVLLAASPGAGMHAGDLLKSILASAGGRGGGNPTLAQGSLPSIQALERALELVAHAPLLLR